MTTGVALLDKPTVSRDEPPALAGLVSELLADAPGWSVELDEFWAHARTTRPAIRPRSGPGHARSDPHTRRAARGTPGPSMIGTGPAGNARARLLAPVAVREEEAQSGSRRAAATRLRLLFPNGNGRQQPSPGTGSRMIRAADSASADLGLASWRVGRLTCWLVDPYGPRAMPMEFLTDAQVAAYGRFDGVPSRAELERFFFRTVSGGGVPGRAADPRRATGRVVHPRCGLVAPGPGVVARGQRQCACLPGRRAARPLPGSGARWRPRAGPRCGTVPGGRRWRVRRRRRRSGRPRRLPRRLARARWRFGARRSAPDRRAVPAGAAGAPDRAAGLACDAARRAGHGAAAAPALTALPAIPGPGVPDPPRPDDRSAARRVQPRRSARRARPAPGQVLGDPGRLSDHFAIPDPGPSLARVARHVPYAGRVEGSSPSPVGRHTGAFSAPGRRACRTGGWTRPSVSYTHLRAHETV